jgi:hypothetical protein
MVQDVELLMQSQGELLPLNDPELLELETTVAELTDKIEADVNTTAAMQTWYVISLSEKWLSSCMLLAGSPLELHPRLPSTPSVFFQAFVQAWLQPKPQTCVDVADARYAC